LERHRKRKTLILSYNKKDDRHGPWKEVRDDLEVHKPPRRKMGYSAIAYDKRNSARKWEGEWEVRSKEN